MSTVLKRIQKGARITLLRLREQGLRVTGLWLLDHAMRAATGVPRAATSRILPGLVLGGQYRPRGWPRLQAAGVISVINMRSEFCDREAGLAPPYYLRLPTVDDEAPTAEQLRQGVVFIEEQLLQGRGVYVHCAAGTGRAATMVAAYLVSQGLPPEAAWAQIRRVRPFIRPTPVQYTAIAAWAALERGLSG